MAGSRVGLFDNLNIPIHRDAQHREDRSRRHADCMHSQSFYCVTKLVCNGTGASPPVCCAVRFLGRIRAQFS